MAVGMAAVVLLAACENPEPPGFCGAIPEQTIVVGETATVSACFEDPNGDVLSYHVTTSDAGVAIVSVSGTTVTVTGVTPGTSVVTVTATDVTELTGDQQFRVVVPNRAPVAIGEISARDLPAGESGSVDVSANFREPDGQPLTYAMAVSDESVLDISATGSVVTFEARAKGTATVTATATDPGGLSAVQSFVVTVPNRTPGAVGTMPAQTVEVDAAATTDVTGFFRDPDGDDLAYTATSSAAAVVVVSISGGNLTVTAIAKGEATVTVTATDTEGLTATQSFVVTVPNRPPLATGSIDGRTIEVGEDAVLELSGYFEDPDGDVLVYSATTSDTAVAGGGVDGGVLTVTAVAKGAAMVTVTATDTEGLAATQEFAVTVPNRPPLMAGSIEGQTIEVGEAATVDLSDYFGDPDGDVLAYTAAPSDAAVAGAAIDGAAMTVTAVAKGEATVTVTATDTEGLAATQEFVVTVPNRPPQAVGSIEERTLEMGETATQEMSGYFEDPDGDDLAYSVSSSDATRIGASIEGDAVTVEALAKGRATVTVTATDTDGLPATQEFAVAVANRPPQVVDLIETQTVEAGETAAIELPGYFEDPDGDALTYTAVTLEVSVINVLASGGSLTVAALRKGEAAVIVAATDTEGMTASQEFVVSVPNQAPLAEGTVGEMKLNEGGIKRVDPSSLFADPDGDALVIEARSSRLAVARAWMSATGVVVRGVKGGTATVTITAEDPEGLAATQRFNVRVKGSNGSDPNRPPVAVGKIHTQNLEEGDKRMVNASSYFDDPDDDELEFSAQSSDLEVVEATVSGNEVELQVKGTGTTWVTVTAQDAGGLETAQAFGVTVAEAGSENRAPVLVGTVAAQTLEEDGSQALDASAYFTDPDNDDLEFSARSSDIEVVTVTVSGDEVQLQATGLGTATVTISAEDPAGLDAAQSFDVTVVEPENPNRAPVAGTIPARNLEESDSRTLDGSSYFSDPDHDELNFSAVSSDTEKVTVTVSGTDIELQAVAEGTATVTITAEDPEGLSASAEIDVTVTPPGSGDNRSPTVKRSVDDRTLLLDTAHLVQPWKHFEDPDDIYDNLTFTATSSNPDVIRMEVRPPPHLIYSHSESLGQATVTIAASDPDGLTAELSYVLTVGNNAPTVRKKPDDILSSPAEIDTVTMYSTFADGDIGERLRYGTRSSNKGVATASIEFSGLYGYYLRVRGVAVGEAMVTVTTTDKGGLQAETTVSVTVDGNRPPRVKKTFAYSTDLTEGDTLEFILSNYFEDPDGDDLTYSAASMVQVDHMVSADTLRLTYNQAGIALVRATATDPDGREVRQDFFVLAQPASSSSQSSALIDTDHPTFLVTSLRGLHQPIWSRRARRRSRTLSTTDNVSAARASPITSVSTTVGLQSAPVIRSR